MRALCAPPQQLWRGPTLTSTRLLNELLVAVSLHARRSSSSPRLALNGWSLELCAAPPTAPADAPAVKASSGPADATTSNATITPAARTANATALPANATKAAAAAQDEDSTGLLEELLARLNRQAGTSPH